MNLNSLNRIREIACKEIVDLNLDLSGLTVLTEAGTDVYAAAPSIAAKANARKVFAWAKDSIYGSAPEAVRQSIILAEHLGVADKIEFAENQRPRQHISAANLVTNSRSIRPIDKSFIQHMTLPGSVICLMFDSWEFRPLDIDLEPCRKRGVPVVGIDENHPKLGIFSSCGNLSAKLAFDAGYEVWKNRIAIWSDDPFGEVALRAFESLGATSVTITTDPAELLTISESLDFLFLCSFREHRQLIGPSGLIPYEQILRINSNLGFVHLLGEVDSGYIKALGGSLYPTIDGRAHTMSRTLHYLGYSPVIALITAGLKTGEILLNRAPLEFTQILSPPSPMREFRSH